MESVDLDELDRRLIHALQIDGRAPFRRIADVLGVSERTIARRYQRLRSRLVLRVVGRVDSARAGLVDSVVLIRCAPGTEEHLAAALSRRPDTSWVALTGDGPNLTCIFATPTGTDLTAALSRLPDIRDLTVSTILRFVAGTEGWPGRTNALTATEQAELSTSRPNPVEPGSLLRAEREDRAVPRGSAVPRSDSVETGSPFAAEREDRAFSSSGSTVPLRGSAGTGSLLVAEREDRAFSSSGSTVPLRDSIGTGSLLEVEGEDRAVPLGSTLPLSDPVSDAERMAAVATKPDPPAQQSDSTLAGGTAVGADVADPEFSAPIAAAAREFDSGPARGSAAAPRPDWTDQDALLAAELAVDGRAELHRLAARTGWSEPTVRRKLATWRAAGVLDFEVEIDPALFGYREEALVWLAVAPAGLREVIDALRGHPGVAFAATITGSWTIFAIVELPTVADLHDFLTHDLAALPGITRVDTTLIRHRTKRAGPLLVSPAPKPQRGR
ncbi:Lrp/AsnC family transcriptional regulator [Nocardia sp. NPDC058176]|uniref:Lrp/AsnC family transcriptional regulator n=1 Tax=Nocardia sp. NPDC058176 TaxID=3346368 RepID=UPI0036D9D1BC